jgi:hypothetical protein
MSYTVSRIFKVMAIVEWCFYHLPRVGMHPSLIKAHVPSVFHSPVAPAKGLLHFCHFVLKF